MKSDTGLSSPVENHQAAEVLKAGRFAAGGAIVSGSVFSTVGSVGLAIGGTAIGLGLGSFVAIGVGVGLAAYGVCSAFSGKAGVPSIPAAEITDLRQEP